MTQLHSFDGFKLILLLECDAKRRGARTVPGDGRRSMPLSITGRFERNANTPTPGESGDGQSDALK